MNESCIKHIFRQFFSFVIIIVIIRETFLLHCAVVRNFFLFFITVPGYLSRGFLVLFRFFALRIRRNFLCATCMTNAPSDVTYSSKIIAALTGKKKVLKRKERDYVGENLACLRCQCELLNKIYDCKEIARNLRDNEIWIEILVIEKNYSLSLKNLFWIDANFTNRNQTIQLWIILLFNKT